MRPLRAILSPLLPPMTTPTAHLLAPPVAPPVAPRVAARFAGLLVAITGVCLAVGLGAGCADDPPIKIRYALSKGPTQKCPADCGSTMLSCKAVLSVRIVDPARPEAAPFLSVCRRMEAGRSLCQMTNVRLVSDQELPLRRLAVQVAVYHADDVTYDPQGDPICPQDQPFGADGYAIPSQYRPAIAGMGYYTPGEEETAIPLGCFDITVVNTPTCLGQDRVEITASADDFDSGVYLQPPVADNVELKVGEPEPYLDGYELRPGKMTTLLRVPDSFPAAWRNTYDKVIESAVCIVVEEKVAENTPSVTCRPISTAQPSLDLRGLRLTRTTLMQVRNAIGATEFPEEGLVVGMVVDSLGKPVAGAQVRPSTGTVQYLGSGRDRLIGNVTSTSGIFISRDTPFKTSWSAPDTSGGYGGLIRGKVTIVILQPDAQ